MVTRNIKIVAQGQADATYASTQKKNPFRLSSAILNGDAYNGETLVRRNMQNTMPTTSSEPAPPGPSGTIDLFFPFNSSTWTFNGSATYVTPPDMINLLINSKGVRSSAFNNNAVLNVTYPFVVSETFRTTFDGTALIGNVVDGFTVAFSTLSGFLGEGGSSLGLIGGATPAVGIAVDPLKNFTRISLSSLSDAYPTSSISLNQIALDICTRDTYVTVNISYDGSNLISWSVSEGGNLVSSSQSGVNLSNLLGSSNAFLGSTAGSGGNRQTVDLVAASYQTYV
jgi:hypothetical protein